MEIKINKGLDLPLGGAPEKRVVDVRTSAPSYAVRPVDVVGFTPRLLVAEGDSVTAGQPLLADKRDPRLTLPSPVDGIVTAIRRGEKRRLLEVCMQRSSRTENESTADRQESHPSTERLFSAESPCWWMLRERPFGTIANPDHQAKAVFVSLLDTNPLAPDMQFALKGREHELECGLQTLATLAPLHVCVAAGSTWQLSGQGYTVHTVQGPHPAGNVGTQIAKISPINKGEYVWTMGAQDVATLGHWMQTGCYRPERVVSVGGPAACSPHYYRVAVGTGMAHIAQAQLMDHSYPALHANAVNGTRIVSGSALTGTQVQPDGHMGMYDQQITFLPEGDQYEFMGWLMPGLDKFSFSRTFLSGILHDMLPAPLREQMPLATSFNTNMHGSVRPFLFTGQFERVFPLDIYPLQLIKACIVGDVELQEKLGIYEVEPEDFALCEFIDPSKTEIQTIVREALEVLRKEAIA